MLDSLDKRILYELDTNARTPLAVVAKRLRVARNVVLYRFNRLKEQGIIKGSLVEVNLVGLGYVTFRVLLRISHASPADVEALLDDICSEHAITFVSKLSGQWDIGFMYVAKSAPEFDAFRIRFQTTWNRFIEVSVISVLSDVYCYEKDYLIDKKRTAVSPKRFLPATRAVDELDMKLLRLLSEDAMRPLYDLAEKTGTTALTVKRRLTKLERDGIIIAHRLFLDLKPAGILYYKLHVALRNYTEADIKRFRAFIESKNYVIYTDHYVNGEEFEIEMQVPSVEVYQSFYRELHERFGTIIRTSYLFEFTERRLFRYLPLEK